MKKILIFFVVLFLLFPAKSAFAQTCEGNCRVSCEEGEEPRGSGLQGCPAPHLVCCIPETPNEPVTCPGGIDGVCRVSCEAGETPQGNCGFHMVCCVTQTPADQQQDGNGETGGETIETAIGPINPNNLQGFIQSLLGIAFGVAGGIAFLLMLFGSFQIMTSSGNPEKMKAGSELITSALTGLLFIIFSVFILKLIGVTILEIPGFGQ